VGRNDGRLTAVDSTSGRQLWEFQTGAGMHAPVSSFEHEGRQYVVAYSAGNALVGSARGDSVWLFGLDGDLPPVDAAAQVSSTEGAGAATGERLFALSCAACHGTEGRGGAGGGPSLESSTDQDAVARIVSDGLDHMPAFGASLTAEQIRDVSAHVVGRLSAARD